MLSRLCSLLSVLAVLSLSALQAAEFKPFLSVHVAGPTAIINVVESFIPLVAPTEADGMKQQLAPFKNLRGVNPTGTIGLAISANEESPFGIDTALFLPINNVNNFNIPGMEQQLMMLKAMMGTPVGNKYTIITPFGAIVAYQKQGFLVIAPESAAEFAASADPKTLFAGLDQFTFGITVNLENLSEENIDKILASFAMIAAMQGMEFNPDEIKKAFFENANQQGLAQLLDMASVTFGVTLDPRTLNLTTSTSTVAKKDSEMAEKFLMQKNGLVKTQLGAFLADTPQTIFSWHMLDYLTDTDIEYINTVWKMLGEGFFEGLSESADEEQPIVQAAKIFLEYVEEVMDYFADERLLDATFWFDSEGTLISAMASNQTGRSMELDKKLYGSLLEILAGDEGIEFIEGKIKRNYETVAGYSLSCLPNIFADLPEGIEIPEEVKGMLEGIPLNLFWAVKENEAVAYGVGLDFAKAEKTLKDMLAKTAAPVPPKQTGVFALKPLGALLQQRVLPLIETFFAEDESGIAMAKDMFSKLAAVDAAAKMVVTTEFPDNTQLQKIQIDGKFFNALVGVLQPALESAQQAVKRMQCSNHLKLIALALHNYHDANGGLPPLYTVDAAGKPLHSWRVLLLPYVEQGALYDQIRFDEPWDSEHNKQFHTVFVPCYACPDNPGVAPGRNCTYVVISGVRSSGPPDFGGGAFAPAAPASESGLRSLFTFASIPDGLSNTIAVVEVKQPFCWMDPTADIDLAELAKGINKPDGRVGSFHPGGCNVVLLDSAVRFLSETVESSFLRALGTRSGGEAVPSW